MPKPQKIKSTPEKLAAKCGHVVEFVPNKKFADASRQKISSRDCKACRSKANLVRMEKEKAEKEIREAAKIARMAKHLEENPPGGKPTAPSRLPDGSRFHAQYDATTETWAASLTIGEEE